LIPPLYFRLKRRSPQSQLTYSLTPFFFSFHPFPSALKTPPGRSKLFPPRRKKVSLFYGSLVEVRDIFFYFPFFRTVQIVYPPWGTLFFLPSHFRRPRSSPFLRAFPQDKDESSRRPSPPSFPSKLNRSFFILCYPRHPPLFREGRPFFLFLAAPLKVHETCLPPLIFGALFLPPFISLHFSSNIPQFAVGFLLPDASGWWFLASPLSRFLPPGSRFQRQEPERKFSPFSQASERALIFFFLSLFTV